MKGVVGCGSGCLALQPLCLCIIMRVHECVGICDHVYAKVADMFAI